MAVRKNYFRRLIDDKDPASSKRFLGLTMSGFLIIAFFVLLFNRTTNPNTPLLDRAMLYAFLIVLMSLFGLAVDKVAEIAANISKVNAAAKILTPSPIVTKVENVEGNIEGCANNQPNPFTPAKPEPGDDFFEQDQDMKDIRKNLTKTLKETE